MKRFLATVALTFVLCSAAMAGEMPTCGGSAPAPSGTSQTSIAATVLLTIISLVRG